MTQSVKQDSSKKKLTLRSRTVETYVSGATQFIMNAKARLRQKKEKFIHAVPLLDKISRKCKAFDLRMERKYGQVYTKLRDSTKKHRPHRFGGATVRRPRRDRNVRL